MLSQFRRCAFRRPLELLCFLVSRAQLFNLHYDFALSRCQFARQRGAACAFLLKRLTILLRARGQLFSCGGLQCESGRFFPLLFERPCALRCFRLLVLRCFVTGLA